MYGYVDIWPPPPGSPAYDDYDFEDFDYALNAYEAVTTGAACSGTGCCNGTSLTTLKHAPVPYSCYLPYYTNANLFNTTVRPPPRHAPHGQYSAAQTSAPTPCQALLTTHEQT